MKETTRPVTKVRSKHTFRSSEYLEGIFRLAEELAMDERERDELGARYQRARQLSGLTQAELANALSYTERTVGAYERGEVQEGLRPAREWAAATGVRYEWLVTGEGEPLQADDGTRLDRIEELLEGLLSEIQLLRGDGDASQQAK